MFDFSAIAIGHLHRQLRPVIYDASHQTSKREWRRERTQGHRRTCGLPGTCTKSQTEASLKSRVQVRPSLSIMSDEVVAFGYDKLPLHRLQMMCGGSHVLRWAGECEECTVTHHKSHKYYFSGSKPRPRYLRND